MKNLTSCFNKFESKQNSCCKCACGSVMRKRDFDHHRFFCNQGEEVQMSEQDFVVLKAQEFQQAQFG
jgi:hypothetical protein